VVLAIDAMEVLDIDIRFRILDKRAGAEEDKEVELRLLLLLDNEEDVSSSYSRSSSTSSNRSRSSSFSLPLPLGIAIGCDEDSGRNEGLVGDNMDEEELATGDALFSEDIPGAALWLLLLPAATLLTTLGPNTGGDPLADMDDNDIRSRSLPFSSTLTKDPILPFPFIIMVIIICGFSVSSEFNGVPTPTPTPTG